MAGFAYEDERGFLTEERKRMVVKLNDAIRPWVHVLTRIVRDRQIRRIYDLLCKQTCDLDPRENVPVYIRFSLEGNGEYVGYTEDWDTRVKAHWVLTCKHRPDAPNPCKG